MKKIIQVVLSAILLLSAGSLMAAEEGAYNPKDFALHHIADANTWHIVGNVSIPLPVIVYHKEDGLAIFLSNKLPEAHHA
ncbi:MAG TPA: F0F1 ATP synthase subunit A, partial [Bacteroidetes bacterium]|nr:F0F1 ATP synthase subunit A [Bacteroidota bacterium]